MLTWNCVRNHCLKLDGGFRILITAFNLFIEPRPLNLSNVMLLCLHETFYNIGSICVQWFKETLVHINV